MAIISAALDELVEVGKKTRHFNAIEREKMMRMGNNRETRLLGSLVDSDTVLSDIACAASHGSREFELRGKYTMY